MSAERWKLDLHLEGKTTKNIVVGSRHAAAAVSRPRPPAAGPPGCRAVFIHAADLYIMSLSVGRPIRMLYIQLNKVAIT